MQRKSVFALAVTLGVFFWSAGQAKAAPETRRIYRLYSASLHHDHMNSTNPNEGAQYGYSAESSVILYTQPYGGSGGTPAPTRPIYRCYIWGWDHMTSMNSTCEGAGTREATLGYVLTSPRSGHVAWYRCRVAGSNEHFTSLSSTCEGQVVEGVLGYIRADGNQFYHQTVMNQNSVNNDCYGRCGWGCTWMPWEAWTDECAEHDRCVRDNGFFHCLDGRFLRAAVSYVEAGLKSLVKAVGSFLKHVFDWF